METRCSPAARLPKIAFFACRLRFPYRLTIGAPTSLAADLTNVGEGSCVIEPEKIAHDRGFCRDGPSRQWAQSPIPLQSESSFPAEAAYGGKSKGGAWCEASTISASAPATWRDPWRSTKH